MKWYSTQVAFWKLIEKKEYLSRDGGLSSSMRMEHPAFHSQKIFNCFHGFFGNALPKVVVVGKMDLKGSQKSNPHQITLVNEPLKITHPATIPIPTLQSSLEGSDSELRCTSCRLRIYLHMVFFSELSQLEKKWPVRWRIHPQEIHFRKKIQLAQWNMFLVVFCFSWDKLGMITGVHVYVYLSTPLTDCHQHQGRATFQHILTCWVKNPTTWNATAAKYGVGASPNFQLQPPIFSCQFREFSRGRSTHGNLPVPLHLRKTNMTVENPPGMKMYFLLNIGIFQCHVRFQGCSCREVSVPTNPFHLWDWIPRPVPLRTVSAAPMQTNLATVRSFWTVWNFYKRCF